MMEQLIRQDLARLRQSEAVIQATLNLIRYLKLLPAADQRQALEELRRQFYPSRGW